MIMADIPYWKRRIERKKGGSGAVQRVEKREGQRVSIMDCH